MKHLVHDAEVYVYQNNWLEVLLQTVRVAFTVIASFFRSSRNQLYVTT